MQNTFAFIAMNISFLEAAAQSRYNVSDPKFKKVQKLLVCICFSKIIRRIPTMPSPSNNCPDNIVVSQFVVSFHEHTMQTRTTSAVIIEEINTSSRKSRSLSLPSPERLASLVVVAGFQSLFWRHAVSHFHSNLFPGTT